VDPPEEAAKVNAGTVGPGNPRGGAGEGTKRHPVRAIPPPSRALFRAPKSKKASFALPCDTDAAGVRGKSFNSVLLLEVQDDGGKTLQGDIPLSGLQYNFGVANCRYLHARDNHAAPPDAFFFFFKNPNLFLALLHPRMVTQAQTVVGHLALTGVSAAWIFTFLGL